MTKLEVLKKVFFKFFFGPIVGILTAFIPIYNYSYDHIWEVSFFGYNSLIDTLLSDFPYDINFLTFMHSILILLCFSFIFYGYYILRAYSGFPSVSEAKIFYREKRRIKRAENQLNKKKRLETAKEVYKQKMQQLEEERKKYL